MSNSRKANSTIIRDVARLRNALEADLESYPLDLTLASYLVVLSGLPGTGKSHFARELSSRLPFVTVGSDRMRKALVSTPKYTRNEHSRVFAACHRLIEELLEKGYRVIFDATNLTDGFRTTLYEITERTAVPLSIIWFTAPTDLIRKRLDDRSAGRSQDSYSDADWSIYNKLRPGAELISRPHLRIDSSQDISPYLDQVVQRINSSTDSVNT